MSEFKRLKSNLYEGGANALRKVIQDHRALAATPVEREFDESWAAELKKRIEAGLAVSFAWAVADMPLDGKKVVRLRMNGNHSSWALAELLAEDAFPDNLAIHLDVYSVSDQAAAVMLFRQFDDRKSSRTKEDISGAYQCFHEAIRGCKRSFAKLAAEGINFYRRDVEKGEFLSGDDVYQVFNEERLHPFVLLVNSTLSSKCRELRRTSIIAAAYGTWIDDARRALEFWHAAAAHDPNREPSSAAEDLDAELLRIQEEKDPASARDLYLKCVKAWSAYLEGHRVSSFKVRSKGKGLPPIAA